MRLFVYIFGSQKRIFRASITISTITGVAIKFFGAPPVLYFVVAYAGVALAARTQSWIRRHPDPDPDIW